MNARLAVLPEAGRVPADARWTISSRQTVEFSIERTRKLFDVENPRLSLGVSNGGSARRLLVVDREVDRHYRAQIGGYFRAHAIEHELVIVEAGEANKSLETLSRILEAMERFALLRRSEPMIVIGGGVVMDVAGLAASLYRRGVPYVRVPTTLMGMVDASVGAKTAINLFGRRNRVGAYYCPRSVLIDPAFAATQEVREISNGLGEILKLAVILDATLFELLDEHAETLVECRMQCGAVSETIIDRSIAGMVAELEPNLWEHELRRKVDFGHSFGPLIEMRSQPELLHGEAVALDVLLSCILSHQRDGLSRQELHRVFEVARRLGLPTRNAMFERVEVLREGLADVVVHRNGHQHLPIPLGIGRPGFIEDLHDAELRLAAQTFRQLPRP